MLRSVILDDLFYPTVEFDFFTNIAISSNWHCVTQSKTEVASQHHLEPNLKSLIKASILQLYVNRNKLSQQSHV